MILSFSPTRADAGLKLEKTGDVLIIDNERFDFSAVPDGGTLPRDAVACRWLASDVERVDGVLKLTLILPYGPNAPESTLFPQLLLADDGPIDLPAFAMEDSE